MENGPFIDDFPIKTSIYKGFSMAMLNNKMVYHHAFRIDRSRFKSLFFNASNLTFEYSRRSAPLLLIPMIFYVSNI